MEEITCKRYFDKPFLAEEKKNTSIVFKSQWCWIKLSLYFFLLWDWNLVSSKYGGLSFLWNPSNRKKKKQGKSCMIHYWRWYRKKVALKLRTKRKYWKNHRHMSRKIKKEKRIIEESKSLFELLLEKVLFFFFSFLQTIRKVRYIYIY